MTSPAPYPTTSVPVRAPAPMQAHLRLFAMLFGRHVPWARRVNEAYARALSLTGLGLKAITIGPVDLAGVVDTGVEGPVAGPVNLVAALPLMKMGGTLTERDLGLEKDLADQLGPGARTPTKKPGEVVYQPKSLLGGFWTEGMVNVAITVPCFPLPGPSPALWALEREALAKYTEVWTPTEEHEAALEKLGVEPARLRVVDPGDVDLMRKLLEHLIAADDLRRHPVDPGELGGEC